jgi:hypothetical protein
MLLGLVVLAVVLTLLLRGDVSSRRATVDELASARAIAAARLRHFAEEREERFRYYHRAWNVGSGQRSSGRGYVLPFATEQRKGAGG